MRPKIENSDPFLVESSPISFFADCILSNTFTEHYWNDQPYMGVFYLIGGISTCLVLGQEVIHKFSDI